MSVNRKQREHSNFALLEKPSAKTPNALCYVYFFKETSVLATTQVVELVEIIATRVPDH